MSHSFRVEHGSFVQDMRLAIANQRQIIARDTLGYLVASRWADAAAQGQAAIRFSKAVGWLFRKLYFDSRAAVAADLAFFRSLEVPVIDTEPPKTGPQWLVATDFLMASAASEWFAFGEVPTAPLIKASICFEARFSAVGAANRTATEFIADSTRSNAERVYAEEFVRRVLCEDWPWIIRQFEPGFGYLLKPRSVSTDGSIIAFCYRVAQFVTGRGDHSATRNETRNALNRCCDTWRTAVINQVPWEHPLYVLYFCVYSFERSQSGKSVSVYEVNEALLGELGQADELKRVP